MPVIENSTNSELIIILVNDLLSIFSLFRGQPFVNSNLSKNFTLLIMTPDACSARLGRALFCRLAFGDRPQTPSRCISH